MKIVFSLFFLLLPLAPLAQEFSPTNTRISYPEADHSTIDSLLDNGFFNQAIKELPTYLKQGVETHNLRSIAYVKETAEKLAYQIRLTNTEKQALFHEFHVIWDQASGFDQTVAGWMLLTLLDTYTFRSSFSFDEESLTWYVGDGYTKLYNNDLSILRQVYSKQILEDFYKTTRIPSAALQLKKSLLLPTLADQLYAYFTTSYRSNFEESEDRLRLLHDLLFEFHYQRQEWTPVRYMLLTYRTPWNQEEVFMNDLLKWEGLITDENANFLSLEIAQYYYNQSRLYDFMQNREVENQALAALEKIDAALEKYPSSSVNEQLTNLKAEILQKRLSFGLPVVPKPKKPNLFSFSYTNLEEVFVEVRHITRIKEVDENDPRTFKGYRYDKEKFRMSYKVTDRGKHIAHKSDFLISCFPTTGQYLVVVGKDKNEIRDFFKLKPEDPATSTQYLLVNVTDIGLSIGQSSDSLYVHVANRWTGKPIRKAEVAIRDRQQSTDFTTDRSGLVYAPAVQYGFIYVKDGEDSTRMRAFGHREWIDYTSKDAVYLDRPIFRPGQAIQFKVLAMKQQGYKLQVDAGSKRMIRIVDRQDRELFNEEITVNEFGSYYFTIATKSSVATGFYTIYSNDQEIGHFTIEEYKRPTFSVQFDPIKGLLANKNPITISGTVTAFAGYPLASELVKIQVGKIEYGGYKMVGMSAQTSDTVFLVYTDNSGKFAFTYIPEFKESSFGTSINCVAKVTRNTGETNFANANFYVGSERYRMDIEKVKRDDWNIEGYKTTITGNNESNVEKFVDFYILKRKNVKRYVKELSPAEFARFSDKEFKKAYPNMLYGELEKEYDTITMGVVQTGEVLNLDQFELPSGEYKIIFSVIMSTKEVLIQEDAFVWREKGWNYTLNHLEIYAKTQDPALMENLPIRINTAWRKVHLLELLENDKKTEFTSYPLKVGHDFTLKLDSSYYFGGNVYASFWKDGYRFSDHYRFQPKDTTRNLEWRWIRKVQQSEPGARETWSFELRDAYGFYVEGEALLNAYDASLDQFAQAYYKIPRPTNTFSPLGWRDDESNVFGEGLGFSSAGGRMKVMMAAYADSDVQEEEEISDSKLGSSEVRTNFSETALFIPQFATKAGENSFEMTMPDNLTTYHFNGFVHTKDGRFVHEQTDFVVNKKLMLEMNQPRFLRCKDVMNWEINFRNLSTKDLRLKPAIQFFSVKTGEEITALFNLQKLEELTIKPGKAQSWYIPFEVPALDENEIKIRIEGRTLDYSDILENTIVVLPSLDQQTYAKSWVVYPKSNRNLGFDVRSKLPDSANLKAVQLSYSADEHMLYMDRLVQNFYRNNDLTESYFYQYAALSVAQHLMQTVGSLPNLINTRTKDLDGNLPRIELEELWPETAGTDEKLYQGYQLLINPEALENARHQAFTSLVDRQGENGLWSWVGKGRGNEWLTTKLLDEYIQLGDLGVLFDSEPFIRALQAIDSSNTALFERLDDKRNFPINESTLRWYQARTALSMEQTEAATCFKTKLDSSWRKLAPENWAQVASIYILEEDNMSAEVIYKAIVKLQVKDTTLGTYWVVNGNQNIGYKEQVNLRNQILGWKLRFYPRPPDSSRLYLLQNIGGMAQLTPDLDMLLATFNLSLKKNAGIAAEVRAFGEEPILVDQISKEMDYNQPTIQKLAQGIQVKNIGDNFLMIHAEVQYNAEAKTVLKSNEEFRIERQYYLVYNGEEIPMKKGITLHEGSLIRVKLKVITPNAMSYLQLTEPRMAGAEPKETKSGYHYGTVSYWMEPRDIQTTFYIESLPAGTSMVSYDMVLTNKGLLVAPAASIKSYYQPSKKANTEGNVWNIEP